MSRLIDLTGQRFGKLVALEHIPKTPKWLCQCDCGNKTEVTSTNLRNGHTKSCGCLRHQQAHNHINMIGKKFGRVTVLEEIGYDPKRHDTMLKCICDCGTIFETGGNGLRAGKCQSCGCYCKEQISKAKKIDMIGKKFGKLTVIEEAPKITKRLRYKCQCECGNVTIVVGEDLRSGHTQSCGCLKSKGEDIISKLLRDNDIIFEVEKTFSTCRFPNNNYHGRFDFWVNNSYLIEFDGVQHFGLPNKWDDKEDYETRKQRDEFKTNWCKENNIPLIRIPYYQMNYLKIEDLLLETTTFREV